MKLFNQLLNNKLNNFDKFSLILFSLLPISLIIGNASTNINIVLIDILFLTYCFKFKLWHWTKKNIFLHLMILYIFLNLSSLYAYFFLIRNDVGEYDGILRSLFFIKFILLVSSSTILLKNSKVLNFVYKNWLIIITIIIIDIFFEKFTGKNTLGYISPDNSRIVSFFKDELLVGALIFCFGYTSVTYFLNNQKSKNSTLLLMMMFLLIPLSVFISGERSNFIKAILLFFVIVYFLKKIKYNLNYKALLILIFFLISCFVIFSETTRNKYYETIRRIHHTETNGTIWNKFQNIKYFSHYDTAFEIFKNYPISGIGNKNFRIECYKKKYLNEKIVFSIKRCSTHPHQIHFEILSEHGLMGYIIIMYLIIGFLIKNIKVFLKSRNINHLSNISYLLIFLTPVLPGGGIFSTFNGALFWIIFSLVNLDYEKK